MEVLSRAGVTTPIAVLTGLSLALGLIVLYNAILPAFSDTDKYYNKQSWAGLRNELFSKFRAQIRLIGGTRAMLAEGYAKYSTHGKPFVVPVFNSEPMLIIPPSKIKQLSALSEPLVDVDVMHDEIMMTRYTMGPDIRDTPPYHFDVVRRQLTRKLPLLTEDIAQELLLGFDDQWGNSESFTSVKLLPTCMRLVSRAANRVFCGKLLCRNADFLEQSRAYAEGSFKSAALIRLFPNFLQPLAAPLITWSTYGAREKALKHCMPVIAHRVKNAQKKAEDPAFEWEAPYDALQWLIEDMIATGNPANLDTRMLGRRLLILNMVAIHTTSIAITNTLLDIFSSPDAAEIVEGLREECSRVLAANGGKWTKDAINSLVRHDSAIRESMRISPLNGLGLERMVVAKDGVDFGDGIFVPHGIRIGSPIYEIHRDPKFYSQPTTYTPFRFSAPRELYEADVAKARAAGESEADIRKVLELKNQALITVGPSFLQFGNGGHACPGRFFASQEMKLMLATVVTNYDVKPWTERPENMWLAAAHVPKGDVEMQVRRRK